MQRSRQRLRQQDAVPHCSSRWWAVAGRVDVALQGERRGRSPIVVFWLAADAMAHEARPKAQADLRGQAKLA